MIALLLTLLSTYSTEVKNVEPGFLLGLCDGPSCRTLWVAPSDGVWKLQAEGQGLLVPRQSGFWWVGVSEPDVYQADEDWYDWLLWAAPAGESFRVVKDEVDGADELRRFGG